MAPLRKHITTIRDLGLINMERFNPLSKRRRMKSLEAFIKRLNSGVYPLNSKDTHIGFSLDEL